jgi:hypothetical protein
MFPLTRSPIKRLNFLSSQKMKISSWIQKRKQTKNRAIVNRLREYNEKPITTSEKWKLIRRRKRAPRVP